MGSSFEIRHPADRNPACIEIFQSVLRMQSMGSILAIWLVASICNVCLSCLANQRFFYAHLCPALIFAKLAGVSAT